MDQIVTLSAVIRAREGHESRVEAALAKVAGWVAANEPQTLAYHVSRGLDDPSVFVTFERFASQRAMESHNSSSAVAAFVAAVEGSLAAPIGIQVCRELSALQRPQGDR